MKGFFGFIGSVIEDILALFIVPIILVGLFAGGFALAHFADMRPPNTPHYAFRAPFNIFHFEWTAPDSPYAQGLKMGLKAGAQQQFMRDSHDLAACRTLEAQRAQADQDAAVERARTMLRAEKAARGGRARVRVVQERIDAFKGTGNACMQAEQIIREFAK